MKIKNIIIIILSIIVLAIVLFGNIIAKDAVFLDELWNFNFARNIANGKLPYKDFNMVPTPLLPIFVGQILRIFGTELYIFRILEILSLLLVLGIVYFICKELDIEKKSIFALLIFMIFIYIFYFGLDYNYLVDFLILLIIYLEIRNLDKLNYKMELLIGLIVGLGICNKQSTGAALIVFHLLCKFINTYNKSDIKKTIKICLINIIGIIIPSIIMCIYFMANNIMQDFIDYAVWGIKTFSNRNPYIYLMIGKFGIIFQILSIILPIFLIYISIKTIRKWKKDRESKDTKIWIILLMYIFASLTAMYPICEKAHFWIGVMPVRNCICLLG